MTQPRDERLGEEGEEPPPFLGSWRRLYAAVLLFLAVQVLAYWALTRAFR